MQYDDLPGAVSTNIEARIQELHDDGVDKELAFPNAVLALSTTRTSGFANSRSASTTSTSRSSRNARADTSTAPG
jgi:hypothetical protein